MSVATLVNRVAALERTVERLVSDRANSNIISHAYMNCGIGVSDNHPILDAPKSGVVSALADDPDDEQLVPDYTYMNLACERASNAPSPQIMERDMVAYEGLGDFSYPTDLEDELVARAHPISAMFPQFRLDPPSKSVKDVNRMATAGNAPTVFYLPAHIEEGFQFPRSGADLLDVQRFPVRDLAALRSLVRLRLSAEALQALQERCAYCFGRFATPDNLYYSPEEWAEVQKR